MDVNGVTMEQINAMATRCGCQPRGEYRERALQQDWRKLSKAVGNFSPEELEHRQTGRSTTILLAALHTAEQTGEAVYVRGCLHDMSKALRDMAHELADKIDLDKDLVKVAGRGTDPVFEDHTCHSLP